MKNRETFYGLIMPRVSVRNITSRLASPASKTAGWRPYSSAKTPSFPGPVRGHHNARPANVNRKRLYAADAYRSAKIGVELTPPMSGGVGECILELEDPGGAKMRVHVKGVEAPDLAALSRSFWGIGA